MGPLRIATLCCLLLAQVGALCGQSPQASVEIVIVNDTGQPLAGVRLEVRHGGAVVFTGDTDAKGHVVLPRIPPGKYDIIATKEGFEPLRETGFVLGDPGASSLELTLVPTLARHEQVEVQEKIDPVAQGALTPAELSSKTAKDVRRPETVADALPLLPGIVRTPAGDLQISGTGEHRSALIVNSADVTDPATGQFGLTVPIDSVESFSVFQTPFLAEYGRFTASLVSVETRRGGEKWKWELNDPFPDFRIYSWHMRGLRDATPRLNVEGPLIKRRLYFSEGLEYEYRNLEVRTLPFPHNLTRKQAVNSFAQLDWISSTRNLVTATVHVAPQRLGYANLDYFNPQPTTPDAAIHNNTGTLADRLTLWGGLLENTLSITRFGARVWARGMEDFTVTPGGNLGNYFAQRNRESSRVGWLPAYSVAPVGGLGTHAFKIGGYVARSGNNSELSERPINIVDEAGRPQERIAFVGGRPVEMTDKEYAVFGQDHWSISSRLAADLGVRTESQSVTQSFRVAPRAGIAWVPFGNSGTVIRAGFGLFYDRVPLNVYSFDHYPRRVVTVFDENGEVSGGPYYFTNALGEVNIHSWFVFHKHVAGDFSPRSATGSLYLEQAISNFLKLRVGYLQNQSAGIVTMTVNGPDPVSKLGAYELSGAGQSRYRQFEVTARMRATAKREMFFSYVRSRAYGDLNEFSNYLGVFLPAVIRPNQAGNLPGDLPNRFLAWGVLWFPQGFQLAPILEYRNGFPYSATDAAQNYVGVPNGKRYPNFLSLDSRFSKDIKVNPKYTVRLSLVAYNLTNHFNPEALHNNIADVAYGLFFGSRGRRVTADFDVLF